jgi:hypothetical protein
MSDSATAAESTEETTAATTGGAGSDGPNETTQAAKEAEVAAAEARLPDKVSGREIERVVVKMTGVADLLEIEGDDVDLGTDLKVRYKHRLVAEFRRDAVDGWWYKDVVLNHAAPFGGEGNAADVGDVKRKDE